MVEGAGRIFFQQEAPVGRYAEREGRARRAGRHRPDKKVLPFLCKKKQPAKSRETGIRGQARVPGRPSGTGRKGFGKERGSVRGRGKPFFRQIVK